MRTTGVPPSERIDLRIWPHAVAYVKLTAIAQLGRNFPGYSLGPVSRSLAAAQAKAEEEARRAAMMPDMLGFHVYGHRS